MTPESIESRLHQWDGLAGGTATLINLSENHTFRIDTPAGGKRIVRVHRPGYHTRAGIESELAWLAALRRDTDLPTITAIPGKDGALVQEIGEEAGAATYAVSFAFEEGREPVETEDLRDLFRELGRMAAICHSHVERWQLPARFERPAWNAAAILDADGLWGDWRQAPNVTPEIRECLDRADVRLRADLAAYGTAPDRFGLIHADMRLTNLLVGAGEPRLIDFDDCGFGWFAYDFAAAVSFFEDSPEVPRLRAAWLNGYRTVRAFTSEDEAALIPAVMLRRMALLAWIGSHDEVPEARERAPYFAANTAEMAEDYLTRG